MPEFRGWLLDLYEDAQSGVVLWFICEDSSRVMLRHHFSATFYAGGRQAQLKQLQAYLHTQRLPATAAFTRRKDLYKQAQVPVLAIETQPARIISLVRQVAGRFPNLDLYDADIPISVRYAVRYGTFPLAYCRVLYGDGQVMAIETLDSPWELDPPPPPLRILRLECEQDPHYRTPRMLYASFEGTEHRIPLEYEFSSILRLNSILTGYDPDLLISSNGDVWLLPYLLEMAARAGIALKLNRESGRSVLIKKEGSYFSYGRIIYRGQQVLLYGRCHIDSHNAMLWQQYELSSALEMARVTRLPIHNAARSSPGTGINMMEVFTAMRQNILVPWQKTHGEEVKTAGSLLRSDQGGLVYQPLEGVFENVGMIDFVSLYPSIMTHYNISPELPVPKTLEESPFPPGLIPQTLKPLLEKRIQLKQRALSLPPEDPERALSKARSSALKMLLVCCFGYMGYKAAKFGRIESHEAISLLGREALLRAKEAAEDMGFTVLHLYVDGIWIQKESCQKADDFSALLNEILDRTSLPVSVDCVYRWIAFLPARQGGGMTVPNRYFGLKTDGSITARGIETRKHDTAPYIAKLQEDLLDMLKSASTLQELRQLIPKSLPLIRKRTKALRPGRVRLTELVVHKRMGRELGEYRVPSPAAMAATQLQGIGQTVRLGQRIPLVYTLGEAGVKAWHSGIPLDEREVNYPYYSELLLRAAAAVLQPFCEDEQALAEYLQHNGMTQMAMRFPGIRV